jgi:transposase
MSRRPPATFASNRPTYYTWLRRYEEEGLKGLGDRSSAPHHMPTPAPTEVVEKILWLRQQYHFGPAKISMYLQRYHNVTVSI